MKATIARIKRRTEEIEIGGTYFLSSFYDKSGAMVKVLSKSTKLNSCGWPSSVEVEVLEPINEKGSYYAVGSKHTVNATNLYEPARDGRPGGQIRQAGAVRRRP